MPNVYEIVTSKFVEKLKEGVVPWRKPWSCRGLPMNLVSKKHYNGVNIFLLLMREFTSPYWLTLNQVKDKGGEILESERKNGTAITFCKYVPSKKDPKKTVPIFRYYKVWNVEQCEGIEVPQSSDIDFVEDRNAEAIIAEYQDRPEIFHRGDSAGYTPIQDHIVMPAKEQFHSVNSYYLTLFHELIHSTGHKSRLDRLQVGCFDRTQPAYAFEELVAELGASFLAHDAGIDPSELFDNSAGYIAGWLKRLENDSKLVVSAAKHSQQAIDYMRGVTAPVAS